MVHLRFGKYILNISKYSSNVAVLGNLGRYPLYIKALKQCVKYWYKLEHGTKNLLLNEIYGYVKENRSWWLEGVHSILKQYGFGNKINEPRYNNVTNNTVKQQKVFGNIFEQRLKDCYIQNWFSKIKESVK